MKITEQIRNGVLDLNNQELFFKILIKGFLISLNNDIKIRGNNIPHYIPHTGDELFYLNQKGYDKSKEPMENTNENYVYSMVPRCTVAVKDFNISSDQVTSPYASGNCVIEVDNNIYNMTGEFRRIPLKINANLSYTVNTFTDALELIQQIITKWCFIRTFNITYMGQVIECTYKIPDSYSAEHAMDLSGVYEDDRYKQLPIDLEIETNIPVFNEKSIMDSNVVITNCDPPKEGNAYNIKM